MEENKIQISKYEDYSIEYNRSYGRFEAIKDGEVRLYADKESDLNTKIANAIKRQEKATKSNTFPIPCYYNIYSDFYEARITSIAEDGDIWISYNDGKESKRTKLSHKYNADNLYPLNEKTTEKINRIRELRKSITKLENEIRVTKQELGTKLDLSKLTEETT